MQLRHLGAVLIAGVIAAIPAAARAATGDDELAFNTCVSCHSVDPEQKDMPGPNLFGVLCRKPATQKGFTYSDPMKAFARKNTLWTPDLLERYISDPEAMIPGTPMSVPPQAMTPEIRSQVIAYLKKHSGKAVAACPK